MPGRKRKAGARTPSGQLSRAGQAAEPRYAPAAIKRLADAAIAAAIDPRLGSEVGRLLLAGKLTARQAGACWQFAAIAADYSRAIDAPSCKTARLERGQRGQDAEEGTEAAERGRRLLVKALRRHERARAVLDGCGDEASHAVRLLAADVSLLTYEQLIRAREGLDALAAHFAQC